MIIIESKNHDCKEKIDAFTIKECLDQNNTLGKALGKNPLIAFWGMRLTMVNYSHAEIWSLHQTFFKVLANTAMSEDDFDNFISHGNLKHYLKFPLRKEWKKQMKRDSGRLELLLECKLPILKVALWQKFV